MAALCARDPAAPARPPVLPVTGWAPCTVSCWIPWCRAPGMGGCVVVRPRGWSVCPCAVCSVRAGGGLGHLRACGTAAPAWPGAGGPNRLRAGNHHEPLQMDRAVASYRCKAVSVVPRARCRRSVHARAPTPLPTAAATACSTQCLPHAAGRGGLIVPRSSRSARTPRSPSTTTTQTRPSNGIRWVAKVRRAEAAHRYVRPLS